ncbi:ATP12 family chaperone protein [Roseovarius autotrophicus]|uniref:ATP12 family chaperone protein n=1 Tax=Roseovarius autotrophicus TaxID=2824121 RepID=UPI0019DF55BD|nr:ATP12 family protein [Roseovarius autotrophicus]MBE0453720.1 ATPase [Roseovarius sp.]
MSGWVAKRFWKEARAVDGACGHGVHLDGRSVRTPAKAELLVPTRALAEAIAAEWGAQEGVIQPARMPLTRAANVTIDRMEQQRDAVAAMLAEYGGSDLLCYRAEGPSELVARQMAAWDPLLDWTESVFSIRLRVSRGVMPVKQEAAALERLHEEVKLLDNWALTAFHDLVNLSGSLIIGFAALRRQADADTLWQISRIDETWQEEQWGKDDEVSEAAERKQSDFLNAMRFHDLSRNTIDET